MSLAPSSSVVFTPHRIGPVKIKNRFMHSSTFDSFIHPDGTPQDRHFLRLHLLAQGEVGLIIPAAMVCDEKAGKWGGCGMWGPAHVAAWRPTVDTLHARGSKIFFQLMMPGLRRKLDLVRRLPTALDATDEELSPSEIEDLIHTFVKSATFSVHSGADGIQLHCAHQTLLSAFLSPAFNRRSDKWGDGTRVVREILAEVRRNHPGTATSIKFHGNDFVDGGLTPQTASAIVRRLIDVVDLFEVSCGISDVLHWGRSDINEAILTKGATPARAAELVARARIMFHGIKFEEEFSRPAVEAIRKAVPSANLAIVGGMRRFAKMENIVREGVANVVALSRPFIQNPFLVRDFARGKVAASACCSCGSCLIDIESGVFCRTNSKKFW
jgi:2,4-dienoyl-CoA reductase-like NADH-dependent reductase (Old Yellow Enzyme family)